RRPGEMLGKTFGLVAVAQRLEAREMRAVERLRRTDRQPDPMDRQGVALAQGPQLRMRRTARPHIVFRMHLKKAERLRRLDDLSKMLGLEADAGQRRQTGLAHETPRC